MSIDTNRQSWIFRFLPINSLVSPTAKNPNGEIKISNRLKSGSPDEAGLLHGFGFSFLLSDLPGPDSHHLFASLLSFNIGIEFSQLLIISVVFILLSKLARANAQIKNLYVNAIAIGSIVPASWWVIERGQGLL